MSSNSEIGEGMSNVNGGPSWKWIVGVLVSFMILGGGAFVNDLTSRVYENTKSIRSIEKIMPEVLNELKHLNENVRNLKGGRDG